ncbi:aarA [Symbiodinium microadriaticum]|nr:aarA [Symbiodinium microadriaticum]
MAHQRYRHTMVFGSLLVLALPAAALEARGPSLVQVGSHRAPPDAAFFADSDAVRPQSSAAQDSIAAAVAAGHRRTPLASLEAVEQQHAVPAERVTARTPSLLQSPTASSPSVGRAETKSDTFALLKLEGLKFDGLKESSGKVLSLVAAGAEAAAESAVPSLLHRARQTAEPAPKEAPRQSRRAPSVLAAMGLKHSEGVPLAPVAALQRSSSEGAPKSEEADVSPEEPQRLQAKTVSYDEARRAVEEKQRHQEDETRDRRQQDEDLMDTVRAGERSW